MARHKRVLVADGRAGVVAVRRELGGAADILPAASFPAARSMMASGVDLVVCAVDFDDARMFDLLRIARAEPGTRGMPFVCFRDGGDELPRPLLESLHIACAALGATVFADRRELRRRYGTYDGDTRFKDMLLECLFGGLAAAPPRKTAP